MSYRLPAEWEKHQATILCWPTNKSDWPGKFVPIYWVYVEIVRLLSESEEVIMIVQDANQKTLAERMIAKAHVDLSRVKFLINPTDRNWMRDSCPLFVKENKSKPPSVIDFHFNAWAKYDNYKKDEKLPKFLAKKLAMNYEEAIYQKRKVTLEGGAIDVNGKGTLLTTEECMLDLKKQIRNEGFTKDDYLKMFKQYLGVKNIIWLSKGIVGDDTHGHVDDITRFVNETTILTCRESDTKEENYKLLEDNYERLQSAVLENGAKPEIVSLPMPKPIVFDGLRVPASYANFYIANSTVIVPTFNDVNDRIALGIIADLFPTRKVCGVSAVDLIWGLGTLHCLSHELPA